MTSLSPASVFIHNAFYHLRLAYNDEFNIKGENVLLRKM